jgi:hypothetical protein
MVATYGSRYHLAMQPALSKELPDNVEVLVVDSSGNLREHVSSEDLSKYLSDMSICETLQ